MPACVCACMFMQSDFKKDFKRICYAHFDVIILKSHWPQHCALAVIIIIIYINIIIIIIIMKRRHHRLVLPYIRLYPYIHMYSQPNEYANLFICQLLMWLCLGNPLRAKEQTQLDSTGVGVRVGVDSIYELFRQLIFELFRLTRLSSFFNTRSKLLKRLQRLSWVKHGAWVDVRCCSSTLSYRITSVIGLYTHLSISVCVTDGDTEGHSLAHILPVSLSP